MEKGGALISKIEMKFMSGSTSRGIYATKDIEKGDELLFVPNDEIVTLESALNSPIEKLILRKANGV